MPVIVDGKVHLFYQADEDGKKKHAICHAVSTDGINFKRLSEKPFLANGDKVS